MSYVEYNQLLFEISQRLDLLNQHGQLLFMFRGRVASRAEDIPDALSLFQELEEQDYLAIDKVELLKELLEGVKEGSLFQKVKKFEDKRKEYKELLEQISRALDESNQLQQLISVCTAKETLDESERNTQTALILFEKLERRGLFAFGRLDFLKGILLGIERQDLVKKVQDFEKRRIDEVESERRKAQARSIVAAARVVGGRVIGVPLKTWLLVSRKALTFAEILVNWESIGQFFRSFGDQVLPADTELADMGGGCVCFIVQASSLKGLNSLWNMYQDGTLKARLHDFLVTEKVKLLAEAEENVELTVTIEEEEYRRACIDLVKVPNASYERLADKPRGIDEHKWNSTKMYVESLLFETKSLMSEASDSGMGTEGAPSEFDVDIGDTRDTQTIAGDDWNSLSSAVQTGNFAIIEDMLSYGIDINAKNNDGNTALILAASTGKRDAVNYLLDKGADPFIVHHSGITPLHVASMDDNVTIIETLMSRGLDVDLKDSGGSTPLMWAAACDKIEAVNYLLDKGADPCIRDQSGRNSLHDASQGGYVTIIEKLMSRGLDVDSKDSRGRTPLMWAAACGKIEAVNYLLDKGADPCIRDQTGRNSLHAAAHGDNVAIIKKMLSLGFDVNSKDIKGHTPLKIAKTFGKTEAVTFLLSKGGH